MKTKLIQIICTLSFVTITITGCGTVTSPLPSTDSVLSSDAAISEYTLSSDNYKTESVESPSYVGTAESESDESAAFKSDESAPSAGVTAEVAESVSPTPSPEPLTASLLMVGDVLLHTPVEKSSLQEDGSYNYNALFTQTTDAIASADLALVNQEVIIGGAELGISGYPCFNADYSLCDTLSNTGFDVICHATNHALDKGKKGLLSCMENWTSNYPDIAVLGIHDSEDTSTSYGAEPTVFTFTNGEDTLRIAVLNYTYGTNGIALPDDMPYAVDLLEENKVIDDIRRAEELADFTVVCPHWGTEYRLTPDNSQKKWAKIFLENGVDLVLGTHPHVIEPVEWLSDDDGHKMLVYYSLGNYVNWTSGTGDGVANRMVGGMADVTVSLDENHNASISDYGIHALVSHVETGRNGVTTYFLADYTPELEMRNEIVQQDKSFSLEYCNELCNSVWGDLWD